MTTQEVPELPPDCFEAFDLALNGKAKPSLVCSYCGKEDPKWDPKDLGRGKRFKPNLLEYHCDEAYYMD